MRCGGYQPPAFQCGHAARLCHLHWEGRHELSSFGMTASGHKQTGHHDMGQVRFTPECVAKTIFTTRTSNIDSRTSTSAQRGFKNTVQLNSIIARSQHLRRQVMGCGIWACLMMWVIRVAPTRQSQRLRPNGRGDMSASGFYLQLRQLMQAANGRKVPGRDIRHGSPRRRDHNADETVAGRAQHVDLENGNLTRP